MLPVMDSYLRNQLFLLNARRMRIGDGDDRSGCSPSVNLRVMGYC